MADIAGAMKRDMQSFNTSTVDTEMQLRMSKACCDELRQINKELVGALKLALEYLDEFTPHGHVIDRANEALAKAKEEM